MFRVCFVTESRIRSIVPKGRIAKRRSSTFLITLNVRKIRYVDIKNVIHSYRSIHISRFIQLTIYSFTITSFCFRLLSINGIVLFVASDYNSLVINHPGVSSSLVNIFYTFMYLYIYLQQYSPKLN